MENVIIKVEQGSIAEELGIMPGDVLLSINEKEIKDVFDYRYLIQDEYIDLLIQKADSSQVVFEIEKDEFEDLGLVFERGLLDKAKSCSNKCIFCFIDQLPENMRDTLYFKDDDSRLSFLQGNYVTLTNMKDEDIERIIFYHLSPINISVHTTDPELRTFMLKNKHSGKLLSIIERLKEANIDMNFQIVLCKDVNDGEHLDKTIGDLTQFLPQGLSLSVVPVGISKYRDNLYELKPFTKEDSLHIITQIEKWQAKCKKEFDTSFVFAADEFYLKAEKEIPSIEQYEDFPQIENGVGMLSMFSYELDEALQKNTKTSDESIEVSVATGEAAYEFMKSQCQKITHQFSNVKIHVYCIKNEFFGGEITVSGLLTGTDIENQLQGKPLGQKLLLPQNAFRADDIVFLDDKTIQDIEKNLNIKAVAVPTLGDCFLEKILEPMA